MRVYKSAMACALFGSSVQLAVAAAPDTATNGVEAAAGTIEEVIVIADTQTRKFELAEHLDVDPDSAALLRDAAGAAVVRNGPLTGIAHYRGMSRFRVNTQVNGVVISSGGPNWMDPPLSYAPAAHLESLEVVRGIASVSAGQETIGGAIKANTWRGEFADDGVLVRGRMRAGHNSADDSQVWSATTSIASDTNLLLLSGITEEGHDAQFPGGDILPTRYERDRFDVGYGLRLGEHTLRFDYGRSETGRSGTPALPMDIGYIDADLYRGSWQFETDRVRLKAMVHASDIAHGMTNYDLRPGPANPGMWRRNIATGENLGFAVTAQFDGWTVGLDRHEEEHQSDIDNPNNPMFFVSAFNDATRDVIGVFVERNLMFDGPWQAELGLRFNRVSMDSGRVNATPAMMGMMAAVMLRDGFNSADRSRQDDNLDWVAKVSYVQRENLVWSAGISRKSRSAAYQERYLWLPLQATAGLADGRTYLGNIDLEPEVAHEIELGLDWVGEGLTFSPRVFYKEVDDYISGVSIDSGPGVSFVQMMNMMNGTSNALPLQFENVDAVFYGFDVDWNYRFADHWSLSGVLNLVRGERDDVDDDLYRVVPNNAVLVLGYVTERWGASASMRWFDDQDRVSAENGELVTSGYEVLDVDGFVNINDRLRLGFGIKNLTDEEYADHLGGINRVRGNNDIGLGQRLPGYGRSAFASLDYRW